MSLDASPRRPRPRRWSASDDALVARLYQQGTPRQMIAQQLGRSVDAVDSRRMALGLARRTRPGGGWTGCEDQLLVAATEEGIPATELARRLGRSEEAVRERRRRLGRTSGRSPRRYTVHEDVLLREACVVGASLVDLARELGRTPDGLRLRARHLGLLASKAQPRWSAEETRLVRMGYAQGLPYAAIAELVPGRTPAAVGAYARELGLATGARRWTVEDDRRLAHLLDGATNVPAIAAALQRTPEAVRLRARKLGLRLPSRTKAASRRPWTAVEDAFLRESPGLDPGALATQLGRSDVAVRRRLSALGLRDGRRGSPHFALDGANGLSAGQLRLIERTYRRRNGRVLISLAQRLGITPGEVKRLAEQQLAER